MLTPTPLTDASTFGIRVETLNRRLKFFAHVFDQNFDVMFELVNVGFPVARF
jgi:predicted enzyme related to lactoylglutathione lyase